MSDKEFKFKLSEKMDCKIQHGEIIINTHVIIPFKYLKFSDNQDDVSRHVIVYDYNDNIQCYFFFDLHDGAEFLSLKEYAKSNNVLKQN